MSATLEHTRTFPMTPTGVETLTVEVYVQHWTTGAPDVHLCLSVASDGHTLSDGFCERASVAIRSDFNGGLRLCMATDDAIAWTHVPVSDEVADQLAEFFDASRVEFEDNRSAVKVAARQEARAAHLKALAEGMFDNLQGRTKPA